MSSPNLFHLNLPSAFFYLTLPSALFHPRPNLNLIGMSHLPWLRFHPNTYSTSPLFHPYFILIHPQPSYILPKYLRLYNQGVASVDIQQIFKQASSKTTKPNPKVRNVAQVRKKNQPTHQESIHA